MTDQAGSPGSRGTGELTTQELWENIGFHRPIAGMFYQLPFVIITAILGLALMSFLYNILYPFPESLGYKGAATGIFGLMFYTFDLGTANIINRFIGEAAIKDPKQMVKYVQYFVHYQMISGLVQTTAISIYALYFVPSGQLAYAVWIMLIYSTVQYPGFLGIFRGILDTLQQFHKVTILNFIAGEVFQRLTEVAFVLLGRWWGMNDPAVGEIMGIAIGAVIGTYVDDFIATWVSARYFTRHMRQYGFTARECFRHDFDRKLVWTCLAWGIKSGIPNFFWTLNGFISLNLWLFYVPQYTTFAALAGFGGMFGSIMGISPPLGGAISEAYFNGKKHLVQYYIHQSILITGMLQFLMLSIGLCIVLVFEPLLIAFGLQYYMLSVIFIIPRLIRDSQQPYNNFAEHTITQTGHINFQMAIDFYEAGTAILSWFVFIAWLQVPQQYGIVAIAWLMPCAEMPAIVSKVLISLVYLHKKVIKLRVPWTRAFVIPAVSTAITFGIAYAYIMLVFHPLNNNFGIVAALVPSVAFLVLVIPFFIFFPLTTALGSWDDETLTMFKRATRMSGLGKVFMIPMVRVLTHVARRSRLHGRFTMDNSKAIQEARELMELKNARSSSKTRVL
nr:hypothetical protein [Candidatus Sigynarchaeum springense]